MILGLGIAAGLGTAISWSLASIFNSASSRHVGVFHFIMMRQPLASLILGIACLFSGELVLYHAGSLGVAALSGLIGLILCDLCLYSSILLIGIRPALVCHSLYSCCTALFGTIFLHEYLGLQGICGLIIATLGVMAVIICEQRDVHAVHVPPHKRNIGVMLALLSAVLMAVGLVLSKEAIRQGLPPLPLSFIRNATACIIIWCAALALGHIRSAWMALKTHPQVWKLLPLGCITGPAGGIWLSSVALENLPAAVASTLIGLQPIALLVATGILERRCPVRGSILGSCAACAGAALLLLR